MPRAKTEGEKLQETPPPLPHPSPHLPASGFFHRATGGNSLKEDKETTATTKHPVCLGATKVVAHLFNSPPRRNPESKKPKHTQFALCCTQTLAGKGVKISEGPKVVQEIAVGGHSTLDPGPGVPKPGAKSCMQLSGFSLSFPGKVATASTAQGQDDWMWSASLHPHILHLDPHLYGRGHL